MIIYYRDGRTAEGLILRLGDNTLRLAMKGTADVETFTKIDGTWISDEGEPMVMRLGREAPIAPAAISLDDFICPPALASHLVRLLRGAESNMLTPVIEEETAAAYHHGRQELN